MALAGPRARSGGNEQGYVKGLDRITIEPCAEALHILHETLCDVENFAGFVVGRKTGMVRGFLQAPRHVSAGPWNPTQKKSEISQTAFRRPAAD
jgi:hypothetical protein